MWREIARWRRYVAGVSPTSLSSAFYSLHLLFYSVHRASHNPTRLLPKRTTFITTLNASTSLTTQTFNVPFQSIWIFRILADCVGTNQPFSVELACNKGSKEENFHNTHFGQQKKFKLYSPANTFWQKNIHAIVHPVENLKLSKDVKDWTFFVNNWQHFPMDLFVIHF